MTKIPKPTSSVSAPKNKVVQSKNQDFSTLMEIFTPLLHTVNEVIVIPQKYTGKVTILNSEFQIKLDDNKRKTGSALAGNFNTGTSSSPDVQEPTKLVLTNTKRTPDIQKIEITIPREGQYTGQVSLITVRDKKGLITSFTPSSNTFIQREDGATKRKRITSEGTVQE